MGILATALVWRGRFLLVTVSGTSMQPSLRPGDRLLVRRTGLRRLRVGQVAVLRPPTTPGFGTVDCAYLVKRVAAVPGDRVPESCREVAGDHVPPGSFIMLGDNPRHSYDSRFAGLIPADLLFGVAVRRIGTTSREAAPATNLSS